MSSAPGRRRSDEPQTDEPEPDLGELLRRASHAMRHRFADLLKPWDVSPHQLRALRVIAAKEPLHLRELADSLRISPRSVTEVVDALAGRGLVERVPDPSDRRAITLWMTEAGHRLMADTQSAGRADTEDYFGRLDATERRQLARLLEKLTAGEPEHSDHHHRRRR